MSSFDDETDFCQPLPPALDSHLVSLDTAGGCLVLCEEALCNGECSENIQGRFPDLGELEWANRARAVQPCP